MEIRALFFLVGMLIWETPLGANRIIGIQGRYFIPLIPAAILSFSGIRLKKWSWNSCYLLPAASALNFFALISAYVEILGI